jgi:hypothetical protein
MERRLGWIVPVMVIVAGCGGGSSEDESPPTAETTVAATTATVAEPIDVTTPGGATVRYPAEWVSYGEGFSGSIELGIPGVANVSVRDSAASEYLYARVFTDQDSLQGAFDVFSFMMAGVDIGPPRQVTVDGRDMVVAETTNSGKAGLMGVVELGESYASVYAESIDTVLPPDAIDAILEVFASMRA